MISCQREFPYMDSVLRHHALPVMHITVIEEIQRAIDEIDDLRAKVWDLERPQREHDEMMARIRQSTIDACAKDIHPVTTYKSTDAGRRELCSHCGKDVTEENRYRID